MKKFFNLSLACLIVSFLSLTSLAQSTLKQEAGNNACSTDCFFSDCVISCPDGTFSSCSCSWGFSYCKCKEKVISTASKQSIVFPKLSLKNKDKIKDFKVFLEQNCSKEFLETYKAIFYAIEKSDYNSYFENLSKLDVLATDNPNDAQKISKYLDKLKVK